MGVSGDEGFTITSVTSVLGNQMLNENQKGPPLLWARTKCVTDINTQAKMKFNPCSVLMQFLTNGILFYDIHVFSVLSGAWSYEKMTNIYDCQKMALRLERKRWLYAWVLHLQLSRKCTACMLDSWTWHYMAIEVKLHNRKAGLVYYRLFLHYVLRITIYVESTCHKNLSFEGSFTTTNHKLFL